VPDLGERLTEMASNDIVCAIFTGDRIAARMVRILNTQAEMIALIRWILSDGCLRTDDESTLKCFKNEVSSVVECGLKRQLETLSRGCAQPFRLLPKASAIDNELTNV
jgi:hypothetical protein